MPRTLDPPPPPLDPGADPGISRNFKWGGGGGGSGGIFFKNGGGSTTYSGAICIANKQNLLKKGGGGGPDPLDTPLDLLLRLDSTCCPYGKKCDDKTALHTCTHSITLVGIAIFFWTKEHNNFLKYAFSTVIHPSVL